MRLICQIWYPVPYLPVPRTHVGTVGTAVPVRWDRTKETVAACGVVKSHTFHLDIDPDFAIKFNAKLDPEG